MVLGSRRLFLKRLVAAGVLSASACQRWPDKTLTAHVVVVGGGFGGATAAKTLRLLDSTIKVTLIVSSDRYITCPGSNWVFAGLTQLDRLTVDYRRLQANYGIDVLVDRVDRIERERRRLRLASGRQVAYDRLILSPGIAFRWDEIAGHDASTAEIFPHAWQAGPQTALLSRQLQAMPDGGVVLITVPADPYRCPPGPYERASMMAWWLKQHKPRAKIIILDAKRSFSKQALFEAGWARHYGYGTANSLIEWHSLADNPIVELDSRGKTLRSEFGDRFQGEVLNIIPAQAAADIARQSGLTDSGGWCPINPLASQSRYDDFIHIIGDAGQYAPIPKSAFAANSEAKACAIAVVNLLHQIPLTEPNWMNTCYSLITPEHGISIVGVYKLDAEQAVAAVKGAGGVSSPLSADFAEREASYAISVYRSLVVDTFG